MAEVAPTIFNVGGAEVYEWPQNFSCPEAIKLTIAEALKLKQDVYVVFNKAILLVTPESSLQEVHNTYLKVVTKRGYM